MTPNHKPQITNNGLLRWVSVEAIGGFLVALVLGGVSIGMVYGAVTTGQDQNRAEIQKTQAELAALKLDNAQRERDQQLVMDDIKKSVAGIEGQQNSLNTKVDLILGIVKGDYDKKPTR